MLSGYCDNDWVGCTDDIRSTSRHIFSLGCGAISWSSKKQDIVALSSSKVEYVATTLAACHAIWLRRLLADLRCKQQEATIMFYDNKVTIAMTKNPTYHSMTAHIDIRYNFIRSLVAKEK